MGKKHPLFLHGFDLASQILSYLLSFTLQKKHGNPNANFFASTSKGPAHPLTTERHIGDLGNIFTASDNAPTHVFIVDHIITLAEGRENSILGRAFVLHAGEDDLGRGGDEESTKTGNAGGRVACGVITAS